METTHFAEAAYTDHVRDGDTPGTLCRPLAEIMAELWQLQASTSRCGGHGTPSHFRHECGCSRSDDSGCDVAR